MLRRDSSCDLQDRALCAHGDGVAGAYGVANKLLKPTAGPEVDVLKGTLDLVCVGGGDLVRSQFGAGAGAREGDEVTGGRAP